MALSAGQQRKAQRSVHLVAGMLVLGYVYVPLPDVAQDVVRYVGFPLLVATGLAMWQAARVRRYRKVVVRHLGARSPRPRAPRVARPDLSVCHTPTTPERQV